jgi:GAF domain-containing protein
MPGVVQELGTDPISLTRFGLGPNQEKYLELDEQILALVRQQDRLVLSNIFRPKLINLPPDSPKISSIIAIALRHENMFFGALWAGYEEPHRFTAEEVRYLVTLGSQAALATANARLFLNAEIGRQRLAASWLFP